MSEIKQSNKPVCKLCGSNAVVKFGHREGNQLYWCKVCNKKFNPNDHLFQMKTPYQQVSSAVDNYYKGDSINEIRDNLNTHYGNYPSSKTVYRWITKYTDKAIELFKDYHPEVGDKWIADETVLKLDGEKRWCIDIIDSKTRFLLGTKLSNNREGKDIAELLQIAKTRAKRNPKKTLTIITDGWGGYREAIEKVFGSEAKHIVTDPFDSNKTGYNSELIERWHGTLKDRTKSLRGLKSVETADKFLAGFLAWYNFMRPHESLKGQTPAEKANIKYTFKSWVDVVRTSKPHVEVLITPAKTDVLSKRKVTIRPIVNRTYDIERKNWNRRLARIAHARKPREKDLGSGVVRDRRGQHLRLD